MTPASPGRVLQRSLLLWGLGERDLGRPRAANAWLAAEILAAGAVAYLSRALADSTWHLLPFLAGVAFVAVWAWQAVAAYRRAQRTHGAIPPPTAGSPAGAIAWLAVPLLAWGAGFWLVAADAASPAAAVDRLVTAWTDAAGSAATNADEPIALLAALCAGGRLARDCADEPSELFRDVRFTITAGGGDRATAVAEAVDFRRRPTEILGFIGATETVPVAQEELLTIILEARPARLPPGIDIGARRWEIVSIRPG